MCPHPLKSTIFFCVVALVLSCSRDRLTHRGFYYWKSNFLVTESEKKSMADLQVKKLYVKFFDVNWNNLAEKPEPAAKIRFDSSSRQWLRQSGIELVPVVFITNETLDKIQTETVNALGDRIAYLLKGLLDDNLFVQGIREIQFDCDWTAGTKEKYFELIKYLKLLPLFSNKQLSATVRLYQSKYTGKAGIPPVDRGLLMCYNMGNLKDPKTGNSILDAAELKKYIDNLNAYPLPMDIALPLFEWKVLFRRDQFAGLISNLPDAALSDTTLFKNYTNRFESRADTTLFGYALKKGDVLRIEKSNYDEIMKTAAALTSQLVTPEFTISLYHLDSLTLSKYKKDELETIYNSLRK